MTGERLIRNILEKERERLRVPWEIVEKDYVISWIIYGLSTIPFLKECLVFKGGTALKKMYFGDYRFSEDLDFSCLLDLPEETKLEEYINQACQNAQDKMEETLPNPVLSVERYTENKPHPEGQIAYTIRCKLPWHPEPRVKVIVEITRNEPVLITPSQRETITPYGHLLDNMDSSLKVYALEEIIAEKLRAILQNIKKLHEIGWSRSRVRDYYDLWRILNDYKNEIDLKILPKLTNKKCELKDVSFETVDDFFDPLLLENAKKDWEQWLKPLVKDLPEFDLVISELKEQLKSIIS